MRRTSDPIRSKTELGEDNHMRVARHLCGQCGRFLSETFVRDGLTEDYLVICPSCHARNHIRFRVV